MNIDFLNWEMTNTLHSIGYDGDTFMWIDDENDIINDSSIELIGGIRAILYSQAFRWFREKHFYLSYVCAPYMEYNDFYFRIRHIGDVLNEGQLESCESQVYNSYEEAELACLKKLIEIVKENL